MRKSGQQMFSPREIEPYPFDVIEPKLSSEESPIAIDTRPMIRAIATEVDAGALRRPNRPQIPRNLRGDHLRRLQPHQNIHRAWIPSSSAAAFS